MGIKKESLKSKRIRFVRTLLGEAVFVKYGAKNADRSIRPADWTISQLRAIADYMEENPKCGLCSDGSGNVCQK